jgi:glucosamine--fructose-6-phosphate aminotransferase (isomerizing)
MIQLALKLAKLRGKLSQDELDEYDEKLKAIPDIMEETLAKTRDQVKALASMLVNDRLVIFLGRGISSATAMEGRLKMLEVTYIPCLAYPAGESKHGPISIIEKGTPCIFLCPRGDTRAGIVGSIMEMKARGAKIISLCEEGDAEIRQISDFVIEMPKGIPELISPIPYVVPLQILAYELALLKGLDPDKPRNLAKSVTVP